MNKKVLGGVIVALIVILGASFIIKGMNQGADVIVEDVEKEDIQDSAKAQPKEEDLVWYEIPELGVKFKVTKESFDDLKYEVSETVKNGEKTIGVRLYSQSLVEFLGEGRCFQQGESMCASGSMARFSVEYNENKNSFPCKEDTRDRKILITIGDDIICQYRPQASKFNSKEENDKYQEFIKNRNFGIYKETMIPIDNN
ncbi:hypothetical protein ACFL08_02735 [Patescibacteria group bacterium]